MGPWTPGTAKPAAPGIWEHGYWPVLDYENHLPADEGDPTPWGGEYLYRVDKNFELFATKFWDLYSDDSSKEGQPVTAYDFAQWIASQP